MVEALKLAQRLGAEKVDLFLDSKLIVEQLHGRWRVKDAKLQPLWAEAKEMLAGFRRWSATHVPRAQNSTADRLANEALDRVAAGGPMRVARARRVVRADRDGGGSRCPSSSASATRTRTASTRPRCGRFPRDVRWPGVLAAELAGAAEVIEEGLNGRTTIWDDPYETGRNGRTYLLPCLRSHAPLDVLVLMLGTNDTKTIFGRSAAEIAAGAGALVDVALASGTGPDGGAPRVLLIAPPCPGEVTERSEVWGFGDARAKGERMPALYRTVAEMTGAAYLDAVGAGPGGPGGRRAPGPGRSRRSSAAPWPRPCARCSRSGLGPRRGLSRWLP